MPTLPFGKYQLKSLHEEIDLFDRKLAHLHKYETFATEAERIATAEKLSAKRNLLIKKAQQMIDEGIEFNETERPKSLRGEEAGPTVIKTSDSIVEPALPVIALAPNSPPSPYAGTSLDYRQDLQAYTRRKRKSA